MRQDTQDLPGKHLSEFYLIETEQKEIFYPRRMQPLAAQTHHINRKVWPSVLSHKLRSQDRTYQKFHDRKLSPASLHGGNGNYTCFYADNFLNVPLLSFS